MILGFISLAKEQENVDFLVFDPKGLSYRPLAKKFDDVVIIPWRSLCFNMLIPPEGADRTNWLNHVVFNLAELGLVQADIVVKKAFNRLYERLDRPNMDDLRKELENANKNTYGVKTQWIDTARAMIVRLCESFGECIFAIDNRQLEYIFQPGKIIVIETAGLVGVPEIFLVSFILLFLRHVHIARHYSGGRLRRVVVVEEGGLGVLKEAG